MDFEVKHIPGTKNTAADGLSRRTRPHPSDLIEEDETDIDEWVENEVSYLSICRLEGTRLPSLARKSNKRILSPDYSGDSEEIAKFLVTLRRPKTVAPKDFQKFKVKALIYLVRGRRLFKRSDNSFPIQLCLDDEKLRAKAIQDVHKETGHRGAESTYHRLSRKFFWKGSFEDCKAFVKSCVPYQKRKPGREENPLFPTWPSGLFHKISLDVTRVPTTENGITCFVLAKEDLSGWPEGRPLRSANSESIAKFLWEDVVYRHGLFGRLTVDGGPENKGVVEAFSRKYGIKRVQISAYNSKANGVVERGHRDILDGLSKVTRGGFKNWTKHFHGILFACRTTIHKPTGVTPFFLVYGREAQLPLESRWPVWRLFDYSQIQNRSDLLAIRCRQLELRDMDMEEIILRKKRYREKAKEA
ncbi:unnamed protein product [Diplocarpon coronariae]